MKKLNPDFLNIFCELNWDANLNGGLLYSMLSKNLCTNPVEL